jgi:SET domain-containing protein
MTEFGLQQQGIDLSNPSILASIALQKEAMGLVNCEKVYVADTGKYGYGVFAKQAIVAGEVIETGLMNVVKEVNGHENTHLFTWSDDRTVWASGSGCLPFYNHAFGEPNMKKIGDLINNKMVVVALRDIETGEELVSKYMSAKWRRCFNDLQDEEGAQLEKDL